MFSSKPFCHKPAPYNVWGRKGKNYILHDAVLVFILPWMCVFQLLFRIVILACICRDSFNGGIFVVLGHIRCDASGRVGGFNSRRRRCSRYVYCYLPSGNQSSLCTFVHSYRVEHFMYTWWIVSLKFECFKMCLLLELVNCIKLFAKYIPSKRYGFDSNVC